MRLHVRVFAIGVLLASGRMDAAFGSENPRFGAIRLLATPSRWAPYENPRDLERITDGLAKAGLP